MLALPLHDLPTRSASGFLDGKTTGDAFAVMTTDLLANAAVEEDELIAACLRFNARNASMQGNPMARVKARPKVAFPLPPPPLFPFVP